MISSKTIKRLRALRSICAQAKSIRSWINKIQVEKVSEDDRGELMEELGELNSDLDLCMEDCSKLWRAFEVIEVANNPNFATSQIDERYDDISIEE